GIAVDQEGLKIFIGRLHVCTLFFPGYTLPEGRRQGQFLANKRRNDIGKLGRMRRPKDDNRSSRRLLLKIFLSSQIANCRVWVKHIIVLIIDPANGSSGLLIAK